MKEQSTATVSMIVEDDHLHAGFSLPHVCLIVY